MGWWTYAIRQGAVDRVSSSSNQRSRSCVSRVDSSAKNRAGPRIFALMTGS